MKTERQLPSKLSSNTQNGLRLKVEYSFFAPDMYVCVKASGKMGHVIVTNTSQFRFLHHATIYAQKKPSSFIYHGLCICHVSVQDSSRDYSNAKNRVKLSLFHCAPLWTFWLHTPGSPTLGVTTMLLVIGKPYISIYKLGSNSRLSRQ